MPTTLVRPVPRPSPRRRAVAIVLTLAAAAAARGALTVVTPRLAGIEPAP